MDNNKVAIITATYNCLEDLIETAKSMKYLDIKKVNWIVVDNCSTDGTAKFIRECQFISKYLIEKDSGIYEAWNKAIKISENSKWIMFIGAGDIVNKDWINLVYNIDSDDHIIYSDLIVADQKKIIIKPSLVFEEAYKKLEYKMSFPHPGMAHSQKLFIDKKFDTTYKIISDWVFINSIPNLKGKYIEGHIQANFKIGGISTSWRSKINLYNEIERYFKIRLIKPPFSFRAKRLLILILSRLKIV